MSDLSEPTTPTRRRRPGGSVPWIWVLPAVAVVLAFRYVATGAGTWYAFTDWDGLSDATWVGLDNFREIFERPRLARRAQEHDRPRLHVRHRVQRDRPRPSARAPPHAQDARPAAGAVLRASRDELAGGLLRLAVHLQLHRAAQPAPRRARARVVAARRGRATRTWALWTIFVVLVWQFVGLSMVMYLAGLEGIPEELDEASAVDGASTFRRFRKITLPLLAPAITVSVTLSTIYGLGVFDQVLAVTGGGPVDASETLATQIYKQTFAFGRFGYGTALSLILTVLITVLAVAQLVILRRRERRL